MQFVITLSMFTDSWALHFIKILPYSNLSCVMNIYNCETKDKYDTLWIMKCVFDCTPWPSAVPNDRTPQANFKTACYDKTSQRNRASGSRMCFPGNTKLHQQQQRTSKLRGLGFSQFCFWPFKSFGILRCVAEYLVPDVSKHCNIHTFRGTHHSPSKRDTITQRHNISSQKAGIFRNQVEIRPNTTKFKNTNHQQMHKEVLSSIVAHSYMFRPCWVIFRENFPLPLH
jgi:hypothetical protein